MDGYAEAVDSFDAVSADPVAAPLIVAAVGVAHASWDGGRTAAPVGWVGGRVRNVLASVGVWSRTMPNPDHEFDLTTHVGLRADTLAQGV